MDIQFGGHYFHINYIAMGMEHCRRYCIWRRIGWEIGWPSSFFWSALILWMRSRWGKKRTIQHKKCEPALWWGSGRALQLARFKTEVIVHFSPISIRYHITLVHFISNHIYPQNKTWPYEKNKNDHPKCDWIPSIKSSSSTKPSSSSSSASHAPT